MCIDSRKRLKVAIFGDRLPNEGIAFGIQGCVIQSQTFFYKSRKSRTLIYDSELTYLLSCILANSEYSIFPTVNDRSSN